MLTLAEAQAAIAASIVAAEKIETVPLRAAAGRYTAVELRAAVDNPAFDNSAMDGYALNTRDLIANSFVLPQQGESRCGDAPAKLAPNSARRIFTGAPLPVGADSVEIQENVRLEPGCVVFPKTVQPNQNIRRQGEDFRKNEVLYGPGRRLTVYDLALLSAAGVADIGVYARPRVLVVATGAELVAPGTPLKPGQIYESNRLATLLQLEALGVEAVDGGVVGDDAEALREMLRAASDFDFIITSGGASVGDHDLVKQAFSRIGEIKFWKAKIKPGKPVAFGRVGKRGHFFALPGNPVSSLMTFKLFVEPALAAWHHTSCRMIELPAIAENEFHRHAGRMEFLRARLSTRDGALHASVLRGQGSHMLRPLRHTNGFIKIAEDSTGFASGDRVIAIPLGLGGEGWD